MEGKVKWFNRKKGFGFITGDDGQDYFVHFTAVPRGTYLRDNDQVSFDAQEAERGKQAVNVVLVKKASEMEGGAAPAPSEAPAQEEAPQEDGEEDAADQADDEASEESSEEAPAEEPAPEPEQPAEEEPAEETPASEPAPEGDSEEEKQEGQ